MLHALIPVRRRRIILGLLAAWLLYLFIKHIPTDLSPVGDRIDPRYGRLRPDAPSRPFDTDPRNAESTRLEGEQYDGPIKFFKLRSTLRAFGFGNANNVLFAFSSPQSASQVITAACAMASYNRTTVHIAVMGRKEMELLDILKLNGIEEADCPIRWHQAQPDLAQQSTSERMQVSCEAAVGHIHRLLPLSAIFFDDTIREDNFLRDALKGRTRTLDLPHLQLPRPDAWMLGLDTVSLSQWHRVQVDILIHVPRDSAGSLLRLLRTIRDADYSGLSLPRITIELPSDVDAFILNYLATFKWPSHSPSAESKLIIRHRIDSSFLTPAMASTRLIESFYPTVPAHSHVLVLSANAELSPGYFQFLMYLIMEYRHGGQMESIASSLFGIALTTPSARLKKGGNTMPISLWQAPSDYAALYFGDEWVQLHDFVEQRLLSDPQLSMTIDSELSQPANWPTWLKLATEWMQIRGKFMLYPNMKGNSPLVTMHAELNHDPEEYASRKLEKPSTDKTLQLGEDGPVLMAEGDAGQSEWETAMLSTPSLEAMLSQMTAWSGGSSLEAENLTTYKYGGETVSWTKAEKEALKYSERFAVSIGGCQPHAKGASIEKEGFGFLFCRKD